MIEITTSGDSGLFRRSNLIVIANEFSGCKTVTFEPNTTIFFTTDNMGYIYYLEEGIISTTVKWGNKRKKIYWNNKCLVNAFMLFLDEFDYEVQTSTSVIMKAMPISQFKSILKNNKKILREIIQDDSYALICFINELNLICFCDAKERIEQFHKDLHDYNLILKMNQDTIAESLALHPVTISKIKHNRINKKI